MKFKVVKVGLVVMVFIGIGGLSFFVPYHAQQKSRDGYMVEPEILHYTEENNQGQRTMSKKHGEMDIEESEIEKIDAVVENNPPKKTGEDAFKFSMQNHKGHEGVVAILEEKDIDEDWIESMLRQYKDDIHEGDVEDFRRIIGKLDIDYAAGLLDNPGGEEGENLLRSYLRSKLSGDEYARGKELFFLYNYILLN